MILIHFERKLHIVSPPRAELMEQKLARWAQTIFLLTLKERTTFWLNKLSQTDINKTLSLPTDICYRHQEFLMECRPCTSSYRKSVHKLLYGRAHEIDERQRHVELFTDLIEFFVTALRPGEQRFIEYRSLMLSSMWWAWRITFPSNMWSEVHVSSGLLYLSCSANETSVAVAPENSFSF